jgi:hypothetical protein
MHPKCARRDAQHHTNFLVIDVSNESSCTFAQQIKFPFSIELIFDLVMYLR